MPLDLTSGPVAPPAGRKRTSSARPSPATSAKAAASKKAERAEGLNGNFQIASFGLMMFGQHADAGAFAMHGENVSREVADLAETSPQVARIVDYVTGVGPYAALVTAVMPLVLQIMANHGWVPASALPMLSQVGVMTPEAMQAKAQADALEMQTRMIQEATEAEKKLRDAVRDHNDAQAQAAASE